eukprot:267513_1
MAPSTTFDFLSNTSTTFYPFIGEDAISEFLWLVILGGFVCFAMAWGIGANDVANAFGTSVGSKAITLKQATVIAGIFEFTGAIALGSAVTNTVRKGIVDYDVFIGEEDLLMLGMFCALCSSALWLFIATKYSLAVSTTQAIVGGICGFTIAAKGPDAIIWEKIIDIIIFWVATPCLAALGAVSFFLPIRNFLLRRSDSYKQTLRWWWIFVFNVAFIMVLFLLIKGLKRLDFDVEAQIGLAFLIAFAVGIGVAIIAYFAFIYSGIVDKYVKRRVARDEERKIQKEDAKNNKKSVEMGTIIDDGPAIQSEIQLKEKQMSISEAGTPSNATNLNYNLLSRSMSAMTKGVNVDIHDDLELLEMNIQENAEKFDLRTEKAFAYLQVSTAALGIFAHGSNDVANAVAPFAAMYGLYLHGAAEKTVAVPEWILAIGATGMTIGLATYGYKIMKCLGVRMAAMTSTRGYCIELSSALTVIIASSYGYPASTTHAQVGATVGAGLLELFRPNATLTLKQVINWKLLATTFFGWILTLIISGATSAALYCLLAYSPYDGEIVRD